MPRPTKKSVKAPKGKGAGKPVRQAAEPEVPEELQEAVSGIRLLLKESPEGWSVIAEALRQVLAADPEMEPAVLLQFLATSFGKEVLPLLRGLSTDEDETLAIAALETLPLLGTRAAGEALAQAYAALPEGERQLKAWKGVEALRAQGINVSVPTPEAAQEATAAYHIRDVWESMPDAVGAREVAVRMQDRYGVWRSLMVILTDQVGVKDGFLLPMSYKDWNELLDHQASQGVALVKVPIDYARWQIAWARARNEESGFPLEEHLNDWDELIGPPTEGYEPPDPVAAFLALPEEERANLTEHMHCLLHMPLFSAWGIEPADLRPWFEEWTALDENEEMSDEELETALEDLLARAVRELLTAQQATYYHGRLLDVARKLTWQGKPHEAQIAAAIAVEIDTAEDYGKVEFLRLLANNGLSMLAEILADGEDPEELRYDPMEVVEAEPGE